MVNSRGGGGGGGGSDISKIPKIFLLIPPLTSYEAQ